MSGSKLVKARTERCRHTVNTCDCVSVFVMGLLGLCLDDG